ncbi:MAG: M23 family metallopeptidase [Cytophagaceae bacterium]|nr:M23 family metallopeptidase [Gemmatimonadaceae bacterium]
MHRSLLLAARLGSAGLTCASLAEAQGRPPIAEGVEVRVQEAPMIARIDGGNVLAWEVHLTNARADTVRVSRVVVTDAAQRAIATFDDAALARWMQPLTRGASPTPATIIPPGVRRVLHAWVPLSPGAPTPQRLVHAVTVSAGTSEFVTISTAVAVSAEPPIVLSPPLRGGPWAAIYDPTLPGGHRTAIYTVDGRARIPGRFAMDFVRLPTAGAFDIRATAPDRNGFGADVLAVGDGTIVAAVDDMRDNDNTGSAPRPRFGIEAGSGNYVTLALGRGHHAFYEHLKAGSITVRVGQRVRAGEVIGQLGHSGSSSIGPHLHFHVADANSLLGSEGRPFALQAFLERGAFADISAFVAGRRYEEPAGGAPRQRRREMPRPNSVVMFP